MDLWLSLLLLVIAYLYMEHRVSVIRQDFVRQNMHIEKVLSQYQTAVPEQKQVHSEPAPMWSDFLPTQEETMHGMYQQQCQQLPQQFPQQHQLYETSDNINSYSGAGQFGPFGGGNDFGSNYAPFSL